MNEVLRLSSYGLYFCPLRFYIARFPKERYLKKVATNGLEN